MRVLALVVLVIPLCATAAGRGSRKPSAPAPQQKPEDADEIFDSQPAAAGLDHCEKLYSALEYERVASLAGRLAARTDLTIEQRLEVLKLLGSAKAVVEDPS
ncbi:MAG TPA: hypothetical protein VH208_06705, partial [Myxococcaceae bacterium]|nr:hypothetical protein [Myxococcaceae bacterium]